MHQNLVIKKAPWLIKVSDDEKVPNMIKVPYDERFRSCSIKRKAFSCLKKAFTKNTFHTPVSTSNSFSLKSAWERKLF